MENSSRVGIFFKTIPNEWWSGAQRSAAECSHEFGIVLKNIPTSEEFPFPSPLSWMEVLILLGRGNMETLFLNNDFQKIILCSRWIKTDGRFGFYTPDLV